MSRGGTQWDPARLVYLLSEERMSTYISAAGGNLSRAFELYEWNLELSAGLQAATAKVEVIVRNAIDHALTDWYQAEKLGEDWLNFLLFDDRTRRDLFVARQRVLCTESDLSHSSILAELSFGFWRFLTSKRYLTTLWIPALHRAFPYGDRDIWQRQKQRKPSWQRHLNRFFPSIGDAYGEFS